MAKGGEVVMNTVKANRWAVVALLIFLGLGLPGCGPRHRSMSTLEQEMEYYAKERYDQALRYMEVSRYELARQQFAIVEQTAVSARLQQLAREGYAKAEAVIEAKR
jgi:hypothetical protein